MKYEAKQCMNCLVFLLHENVRSKFNKSKDEGDRTLLKLYKCHRL